MHFSRFPVDPRRAVLQISLVIVSFPQQFWLNYRDFFPEMCDVLFCFVYLVHVYYHNIIYILYHVCGVSFASDFKILRSKYYNIIYYIIRRPNSELYEIRNFRSPNRIISAESDRSDRTSRCEWGVCLLYLSIILLYLYSTEGI